MDGSLSGTLYGTYITNVDTNIFDAIRELLSMPSIPVSIMSINKSNVGDCYTVDGDFVWDSTRVDTLIPWNNNGDAGTSGITLQAKQDSVITFDLDYKLLRSNDYVKIYKNDKIILSRDILNKSSIKGYKFEQYLKKK